MTTSNYSRIALSAVTLLLISLSWAWNKPALAWIAVAIAVIDLPANVIANGMDALRRGLDTLAVVGPPLLFLPILFLHRAVGSAAAAGGPNAELATRFLGASTAMLVCNTAINVVGLAYLILFKTNIAGWKEPRTDLK